MFYKFPKVRRRGKVKLSYAPREKKGDEETTGIVQGRVTDSKEELWVAKALDQLKLPYTYQYPLFGGNVRGGYKIDFVVQTVPLATMIEIYGNYWHEGDMSNDDKRRQADIEDAMKETCRTPIQVIWASNLTNEETVLAQVRKAVLG